MSFHKMHISPKIKEMSETTNIFFDAKTIVTFLKTKKSKVFPFRVQIVWGPLLQPD